MRKSSACLALFVLSFAFAAEGCVGDDSAAAPVSGADAAAPPATPAENQPPAASSSSGGSNPETPAAKSDAGAGAPDASTDDAESPPVNAAQVIGYVFSSSPAADSSTPSAYYAYNAAGGAMKIARTATGTYDVSFADLDLSGSVALVSSYGTAGGLCMWSGTTAPAVTVRCFDAAGSVADAKFSLTVFGKGTKGATVLGFAHANDKFAASYTPAADRSNNAIGGGTITASRSAKGKYTTEFGGLALLDIGNVQVMPYGDANAFCSIDSWSGAKVNVSCFDGSGNPADAQYTVMLLGTKTGSGARVLAYAHAAEAASASYAPSVAYNDGAAVTATRLAAGTYKIVFDGQNLNSGAHVQVTSHGKGRRCNVSAWAGNTVDLTCTSTGGLADNNYAVVVLQ